MAEHLTPFSLTLTTSLRQNAHVSQDGFPVNVKENLCHRCSAMPVDSQGLTRLMEASVAEIERRGHYCESTQIGSRVLTDLQPGGCPLCRVFVEASILARGPSLYFTFSAETFIDARKRVWAPSFALKLCYHTAKQKEVGNAWIVVTSNRTEDDSPKARPTTNHHQRSKHVDWDTVKGYLATCISEHRQECRRHGQRKLRSLEIQVIDCTTRHIRPAPVNCKYAALSYVWGSSSDTPQFSSQLPAPGLVPLLIEDAMKCTREIGLRYLWIDRYCIDQHDESTKYATIQRMDQIYRQSTITIINAAGSGADCGLAGVSTVPLRKHCVANIDGRNFSILPDIRTEVSNSSWSSRGWTYQEGLLARRRLIFTESQVHFQCLDMKACWPLQLSNDPNRMGWHDESDKGNILSMMHAFPFFPHDDPQIQDRLQEYLGRTLTHSTDILNAFMGILRQAWLLRKPTYHFWGLPFLPAFSLESSFLDAMFWLSINRFGSELLSRRDGFPSWNWTGWRGLKGVEWRSDMSEIRTQDLERKKELYHLSDMARELELFIQYRSGNRVTLAEYVIKMGTTWNMFEFEPHINITGWMTIVRLFGGTQRRSLTKKPPQRPDIYERERHLANTTLGSKSWQVYAYAQILDGFNFDVNFWRGLKTQPSLCHAMLFFESSGEVDAMVSGRGLLLKKMDDGSYERMGQILRTTGQLNKETEKNATASLQCLDGSRNAALELECELRTIKLV
ncbi:heterokaryon incompatibility protein-domain-containing protein [Paraphoma chrysanthemicola]|nr:heterokaryon incompatibility protein-domain-containing protein [Paraphoma chrysanthemicola]